MLLPEGILYAPESWNRSIDCNSGNKSVHDATARKHWPIRLDNGHYLTAHWDSFYFG